MNGRRTGMTIMPDPTSFNQSWFHVRDYGVVASPFGPRAGAPARTAVKKGRLLRMRFGVLVYSMPHDQLPDLKLAYRAYLIRIKASLPGGTKSGNGK